MSASPSILSQTTATITATGNRRAMIRRAFSVMLRRSTKSLLPLATSAVASPMAFQRTITTQRQTVAIRNSLPAASRFFSGDAGKDDLRSINLDYLHTIFDAEPQKGDDIPFQMVDISTLNKSEKKFSFTKTYNGEYTCVQVFVNSASSGVLLLVTSMKPDGRPLAFHISPPLDSEMRIDHLIVSPHLKQLMQYERILETGGDLGVCVYNFSELDENLKAGFAKYIAVRGITADWWRKVAPVMC